MHWKNILFSIILFFMLYFIERGSYYYRSYVLSFEITALIYAIGGYILAYNINAFKTIFIVASLRFSAFCLIHFFLLEARWQDIFGLLISIASLFLGFWFCSGNKYASTILLCAIFLSVFIGVPHFKYKIQDHHPEQTINISDLLKQVNFDSCSESSLKILVIDFWFTSCSNCYKGFPTFNALNNKFKDKDCISFIAVNDVDKVSNIYNKGIKRIKRKEYEFEILIDSIGYFNQFNSFNKYPSQVIITSDGVVRYTNHGYSVDTENLKEKEMSTILEGLLSLK